MTCKPQGDGCSHPGGPLEAMSQAGAQNQDGLAPAFFVKCFTVQVSKLFFSKESQCLSRDFAVRGCDISGMRSARHCSAWYLCCLLWCHSPTRCHGCSLQHLLLSRCCSNGSGFSLSCTRRGKRVLQTSQEAILCTLCQGSGNFVQRCCLLWIWGVSCVLSHQGLLLKFGRWCSCCVPDLARCAK